MDDAYLALEVGRIVEARARVPGTNRGDLVSATQVNVNDGTPEGPANDDLDVRTRQYHPEANPGPRDTLGFFDDVIGTCDGEP